MTKNEFLPVNLDAGTREEQGRSLRLVRVDRELKEELSRYSWKHQTKTHRVYRVVVDHDATDVASAAANRVLRKMTKLHLQTLLKGRENVIFKNGDTLDFRMDNMSVCPDGVTPPAPTIVPGSTFDRTPEYAAALEWTKGHEDELRARSKGSRATYDQSTTAGILDMVKSYGDAPITTVFTLLQLDVPELFDTSRHPRALSISMLRDIVQGRTCRLPGYDYEALRAARPKAGRPPKHRDIFS